MGFLERVNATPLDPELMKRMAAFVADLPAEERSDMEGRSIALIRFLHETVDKEAVASRGMILTSFEFRMEALARLPKRPEYKAWIKEAKHVGDPDLIHEAMIEVAASHPLIERNKHPAFEPAAFFHAVLDCAEAEGRA